MLTETLRRVITNAVTESSAPMDTVQAIRELLHRLSPRKAHAVDFVRWVPIEKVTPNDYNPNSVAKIEMGLLHTSISHDSYTQPVVTFPRKRACVYLPCGHNSQIDSERDGEDSVLWKIIPCLSGSWDIRLESLMEKEALASCTALKRAGERAVIESKSVSQKATAEKDCASGFNNSGRWDEFTKDTAYAISLSGTSRESMTLPGCSELVCPICASSDPERKSLWTTCWTGATVSDAASGLRVSWRLSESAEAKIRQSKLQHVSKEALTPCEQNETNSVLTLRPGIAAPVLRVIDETILIIIDGFHRYYVCKTYPDILEWTGGMLPVVVIDKPLNDRMASTVRHNRARGKHSVQGMSQLVFSMLEGGWEDEAICQELGMSPEELLRLKHVTGFSKLFQDTEYRRSWMTKRQIQIRKRYRDEHPDEAKHG